MLASSSSEVTASRRMPGRRPASCAGLRSCTASTSTWSPTTPSCRPTQGRAIDSAVATTPASVIHSTASSSAWRRSQPAVRDAAGCPADSPSGVRALSSRPRSVSSAAGVVAGGGWMKLTARWVTMRR